VNPLAPGIHEQNFLAILALSNVTLEDGETSHTLKVNLRENTTDKKVINTKEMR